MSPPRSFQVYAFLRHMLLSSKRTGRTLFIEAFILGAIAAAPVAALGYITPAGGIVGFFILTALIRVVTINKGDRTRIEASTRTPTKLIVFFAILALVAIPGIWIASGLYPEPLEPSPALLNEYIPLLQNNIPLVLTSTLPFLFNILYWVWLRRAASAYNGERQFYVNEYTPLSNKWAEASAAMEKGHAHREKGNKRRAFYFFTKAQTRYNKLNDYADRETYEQVAEQHAAAAAEYKLSVGTKDEDEQKEAFNKGNEYIQRATKNLKTRKCDHCGGTFPVSEIHRTVTMDGLEKNLYCPECYEKPATSKGARADEEEEPEQQKQEVEAGGKKYEVATKEKEEKKEKKGYFDDSEFLSGGLASSPTTEETDEEEEEPDEKEDDTEEEDDGNEWEDWDDDWEDDEWGDDETTGEEEEQKSDPEQEEDEKQEEEPKTTTTTRTRRVSRTSRTRNVHREPVETEEPEPEPEPEITEEETEPEQEEDEDETSEEEETGRKKRRTTSQRQTRTSTEDESEPETEPEEEDTTSSTGRSTKGRRGRSKSTPTQSAPTSQSSETKISDEKTESEDEREVESGSKPDREYSKVGSVTTDWAIAVLELDGEPEGERELKKAFRRQMRDHHPDHGGNREDFKKVQDARERLQKFLKYSD